MTNLLDIAAIDREIAQARRRVDTLENIRELVRQLNDETPAETARAPPSQRARPRRSTRSSGSGSFERTEPHPPRIVAWIAEQPTPQGRGRVAEKLGGNRETIGGKLQALCKAGELIAFGEGARRTYGVPGVHGGGAAVTPVTPAPRDAGVPPGDTSPPAAEVATTSHPSPPVPTTPRAVLGTPPSPPAPGTNLLYDAIVALGTASFHELVDETRLAHTQLHDMARALVRAGHVVTDGFGEGKTWTAAAPTTEARIFGLVTRYPGDLNDEALADALNVPLSECGVDIASALDADLVVLADDGRYYPAGAEPVAETVA